MMIFISGPVQRNLSILHIFVIYSPSLNVEYLIMFNSQTSILDMMVELPVCLSLPFWLGLISKNICLETQPTLLLTLLLDLFCFCLFKTGGGYKWWTTEIGDDETVCFLFT